MSLLRSISINAPLRFSIRPLLGVSAHSSVIFCHSVYAALTSCGQNEYLFSGVGKAAAYFESNSASLRLLRSFLLRSSAFAALWSSRKRTLAPELSPLLTQSVVATPCWMPGENPATAKIVSLVRPSDAYSEIFRLPCRFSIQTLLNALKRCFLKTTNDGSRTHDIFEMKQTTPR